MTVNVTHGGVRHVVRVKRVAVAKRFTLRFAAITREPVLTMPTRASLSSAVAFVERQAAWLSRQSDAMARPIPFDEGRVVPLRGVPHLIATNPLTKGVDAVTGHGAPTIVVPAGVASVPAAVRAFLVAEAGRDLGEAVARHARAVDRVVGQIRLKDTARRWGSCTVRGDLNFSWRIVMAPPMVLDYLAAHEVGHRVHMNHSKAFWEVVRGICPATDEAEDWLRRHGLGLHGFGERM